MHTNKKREPQMDADGVYKNHGGEMCVCVRPQLARHSLVRRRVNPGFAFFLRGLSRRRTFGELSRVHLAKADPFVSIRGCFLPLVAVSGLCLASAVKKGFTTAA
jgi:hypothetical protein